MDEISFAIIAITVALVAVFLPLAFQTSATGRLFVEFAVAVAGFGRDFRIRGAVTFADDVRANSSPRRSSSTTILFSASSNAF